MVAQGGDYAVDATLGGLLHKPLDTVDVLGGGHRHGECVGPLLPVVVLGYDAHRATLGVGVHHLGIIEGATSVGEVECVALTQALIPLAIMY